MSVAAEKTTGTSRILFEDNRSETLSQRKWQEIANNNSYFQRTKAVPNTNFTEPNNLILTDNRFSQRNNPIHRVVQRCIDPKKIDPDKNPSERIGSLKTYADVMCNKAAERLSRIDIESEPELYDGWYGIMEQFEKIVQHAEAYSKADRKDLASVIESLEDFLDTANAQYTAAKTGKVESAASARSAAGAAAVSSSSLSSGPARTPPATKAGGQVENELQKMLSKLPGREFLSRKGIKGVHHLSSSLKRTIIETCQKMVDLKQRMQSGDVSALIDWMDLFRSLLSLVESCIDKKPEDYAALIQLGVINELRDALNSADRGEICNEELPKNIHKKLKGDGE